MLFHPRFQPRANDHSLPQLFLIPQPQLCRLRHPIMLLRVKLVLVFVTILLFSSMGLSQSVIENLPGFPGKLPFRLETGYLGVGESEENQLFYYFIESEGNPKNDPLMLWLTGGPSCSAFSGLVYEIGPFIFDYANSSGSMPALVLNQYSWTKVASIIFLDQPAGSGFSYAQTPEAYKSSDTLAAARIYEFLKKWLLNHPEYLDNPLYIAGDSYCGITLPLVVDEVYKGIKTGSKPLMNMKGYLLGNPVTDIYSDFNERIPYAHRMGLLSDKLYQTAKENCNGYYLSVSSDNVLCQHDLEKITKCLNKTRIANILEPWCPTLFQAKQDLFSWSVNIDDETPGDFLLSLPPLAESWCREDNYVYCYKWANNKSVQEALHIREGTITEWVRCNSSFVYEFDYNQTISYTFTVKSTVSYHQKFSHKDCRALIYSGDHDMVVPHSNTEKWIDSLDLPVQSDWRPWFVEGQVAGYTLTYSRDDYELTYATVKGAGHTAPEYKPVQCLAMIQRWFSSSPL